MTVLSLYINIQSLNNSSPQRLVQPLFKIPPCLESYLPPILHPKIIFVAIGKIFRPLVSLVATAVTNLLFHHPLTLKLIRYFAFLIAGFTAHFTECMLTYENTEEKRHT